ncbi:MAG: putative acetyltransferase [Firmicutes bacterium ADurb.Bin506]|jgi:GNAT superfamily N-acetyltransferase|nr:MAG: putative acetyltransferase [Firmicutes bacterium ADurb.Bin506]
MEETTLTACSAAEIDYIHSKLIEYNKGFIHDDEQFGYAAKDCQGRIAGGIVATRNHQCMTIDYLWVDEEMRGRGIGSKLVAAVENAARQAGCTVVWLNTFDFQAPEFYTKLGYELFGVLDGCMNGHSQRFFRKNLSPPQPVANCMGASPWHQAKEAT